MRNNKYVAIVLALVAVALVAYRLLERPAQPRVPEQTPLVPVVAQAGAQAEVEPTTDDAKAESGGPDWQIDANSPLLWQRVTPQSLPEFPLQELPAEFGVDSFFRDGGGTDAAPPDAAAAAPPELALQAVISDGDRRIAVINRMLVREGESISGAVVVRISHEAVELRWGEQTIQLRPPRPGGQTIEPSGGKSGER